MVFAVHGTVSGNFATRVPWIQQHLSLGAGEIGLALLCVALGSFLSIPLAGRLVRRFGPRPVTRVSLLALCLGLATPAVMPDFGTLCAVLLVYGAAAGASDAAMKQQAIAVERDLERPIMSRLHGLWSIGTLIGAGIGTAATFAALDARIHLAAVGGALAVLAAVVVVALPATRVEEPEAVTVAAPRRRALPGRTLLILGLLGFCASFAEAAAHSWSSVFIAQLPGGAPATASLGFAVFVATMAVGRLCGDRLVQEYGPVTVVRLGGLLSATGAVLAMAATAPALAMAGFAMLGLGLAAIGPVVVSAAGRTTPGGNGVSTVVTICYLACLASPGAIGGIADRFSLAAAFGITAVVILVIVVMAGVLGPQAAPATGTTVTRIARLRPRRISFTRVARSAPVVALTLGRSARPSDIAVSIGEPVVASAPVTVSFADDSPTVEMPAMSRRSSDDLHRVEEPARIPAVEPA
ncbi:MFS transporter [Stackebrandtia albiflava]|nr:MFS transporter [Stackebrandtia albiflava]